MIPPILCCVPPSVELLGLRTTTPSVLKPGPTTPQFLNPINASVVMSMFINCCLFENNGTDREITLHRQAERQTDTDTLLDTWAETWRRVWGAGKNFADHFFEWLFFRKKIHFNGQNFWWPFKVIDCILCLSFVCLFCLKSEYKPKTSIS